MHQRQTIFLCVSIIALDPKDDTTKVVQSRSYGISGHDFEHDCIL